MTFTLNNLANLLSQAGRYDEALQTGIEVVEIRRRLAEQLPAAFIPDLALSLSNLSNRYLHLGRPKDALPVALEAVELRRRLAGDRPALYTPNLAISLNSLSNCLDRLHDTNGAFEAAAEAVELLLPFYLQAPDTYEKWMQALVPHYMDLCDRLEEEPVLLYAVFGVSGQQAK
ncbi:tetratricopeptide repeat protein [Rhizobium ruizarguesonis]|nr:tetratricopeptide repeat protein [Rhizobium ruizarguesonis]